MIRGDGEVTCKEEIEVLGAYRFFMLENDNGEPTVDAMQMGFVNFVEEGHEYLIFLSGKCETIESNGKNVYQLVPVILSPVFDYEQRESHVLSDSIVYNNVAYEEIRENEFFAGTAHVLELMEGLKQELLEMYPR